MTVPNDQRQQEQPERYYVDMSSSPPSDEVTRIDENNVVADPTKLSPFEVQELRQILNNNALGKSYNIGRTGTGLTHETADSEYTEFGATTHAWAVFADDPQRRATKTDRVVGTIIIFFQLFTYGLFASEAIEDYQLGVVPVTVSHETCQANNEMPDGDFQCNAEYTSNVDAVVAFFMLAVFLTPDILQAGRAIIKSTSAASNNSASASTIAFACLAGIEVVCAFLSAATAISYQLYIGEVTDAIEVGVGLLFIRELSARAYEGIRHNGVKQYKTFLAMMAFLITGGFIVEWFCERHFASSRIQ